MEDCNCQSYFCVLPVKWNGCTLFLPISTIPHYSQLPATFVSIELCQYLFACLSCYRKRLGFSNIWQLSQQQVNLPFNWLIFVKCTAQETETEHVNKPFCQFQIKTSSIDMFFIRVLAVSRLGGRCPPYFLIKVTDYWAFSFLFVFKTTVMLLHSFT